LINHAVVANDLLMASSCEEDSPVDNRIEPIRLTECGSANDHLRINAPWETSPSEEAVEAISFLTEVESKSVDYEALVSDQIAEESVLPESILPEDQTTELKVGPQVDKWTELQLRDAHSTRCGFERRLHNLSTHTVSGSTTAGRSCRCSKGGSPASSNFSNSVGSAFERTASAPSTPLRHLSSSPIRQVATSEGRARSSNVGRKKRLQTTMSASPQIARKSSAGPQLKQSNAHSQNQALSKQQEGSNDLSSAKRIENLLLSHIGAMDTFAIGLRDAARICQEMTTSGPQHYSIATPGRETVIEANAPKSSRSSPSNQRFECVHEESSKELSATSEFQLPDDTSETFKQCLVRADMERSSEQFYRDTKRNYFVSKYKHFYVNADHPDFFADAEYCVAADGRSPSPRTRSREPTKKFSSSDKVPPVHVRLHESAEEHRARRTALQDEWRAREDRELTFHPQVNTVQNSQAGSATVYSRLLDDAARRRKVEGERAIQQAPTSRGKSNTSIKPARQLASCGSPVLQRQRNGSRPLSTPSPAALSQSLHHRFEELDPPMAIEKSTIEMPQKSVVSPQKPTLRLEAHAEAASVFGGFVMT